MQSIVLQTSLHDDGSTSQMSVKKICLHGGADDLGSIMIEENVVSQAGASYSVHKDELPNAIKEAGFTPQLRNQHYDFVE